MGRRLAERAKVRPPTAAAERQRFKALQRENFELKRANEILRKASAYLAHAELDRRCRRPIDVLSAQSPAGGSDVPIGGKTRPRSTGLGFDEPARPSADIASDRRAACSSTCCLMKRPVPYSSNTRRTIGARSGSGLRRLPPRDWRSGSRSAQGTPTVLAPAPPSCRRASGPSDSRLSNCASCSSSITPRQADPGVGITAPQAFRLDSVNQVLAELGERPARRTGLQTRSGRVEVHTVSLPIWPRAWPSCTSIPMRASLSSSWRELRTDGSSDGGAARKISAQSCGLKLYKFLPRTRARNHLYARQRRWHETR